MSGCLVFKKVFFGFLELSLRRLGKQANIIHYDIRIKASELRK